ncbi:hypothetical protein PFISCL1PPCAC_9578, partial [Pristionchus fissidentatus]
MRDSKIGCLGEKDFLDLQSCHFIIVILFFAIRVNRLGELRAVGRQLQRRRIQLHAGLGQRIESRLDIRRRRVRTGNESGSGRGQRGGGVDGRRGAGRAARNGRARLWNGSLLRGRGCVICSHCCSSCSNC